MRRLLISQEIVGRWSVDAVIFEDSDQALFIPVIGIVGNAIPTSPSGKQKLRDWKIAVATAAKTTRGNAPLDPAWRYSISVGFSFYPPAHGNQALDVENFLKPSFDALAAGLFCANSQDPRSIERYNYDDSHFVYLFIHRLPDARQVEKEGAGFVVSICKSP